MLNSSNIPLSGPLNGTECHINGNSDIYGLGIRLGFYSQWISSIIACFPFSPGNLDPPIAMASGESENTTFGLIVFIIATFIALLKQTKELASAEIYVILLLIFGFHYYWFPDLVIKVIMRFTSIQMLKREKPHRSFYRMITYLYVLFISGYQLWFWFPRLKSSSTGTGQCQRFVFGFKKINLDNRIFSCVNIAYSFVLLFWSLWSLWSLGRFALSHSQPWLCPSESEEWKGSTSRSKRSSRIKPHENQLQLYLEIFKSIVRVTLIIIIIIAIELSITWNEIVDVQSLSSVGQMIPFMVGFGPLLRVLYVTVKTHGTEFSPSSRERWPGSEY